MNYYIAYINKDGLDWAVFQTTDEEYAYRVFEDLSTIPGWNIELRATEEDIDTHLHYEVLRYDHSEF